MSEAVVVVGGGPAGAAAALRLARAGRSVTVLERDAEPSHRVCGEFVGGDGLDRLDRLGVDLAALDAQPITRVRFARGGRAAVAALPFRAAGVCRRALDAALLAGAASAGATVLRGRAARTVDPTDGTIAVEGMGTLRPPALLLASGKQDVRGVRRDPAGPPDRKVGFKTHLRLTPAGAAALGGWVELMMFAGAYAGLQMVGRTVANLCLVVTEARLAEAGNWSGLLVALARECPLLARRLDGSRAWDRPLAVARTPYGFVHAPSADERVFRLGDQMGVIPSFTGDGIAIALHTGALAADTLLAGGSADAYHARARRSLRRPIGLATALYGAGHARSGQAAMMTVARLWPGALSVVASLTRAG